MNYAPSSLTIAAASLGFIVSRTYSSATKEEPENVVRDTNGVWCIKKGKLVHVEIKMVKYFVLLK